MYYKFTIAENQIAHQHTNYKLFLYSQLKTLFEQLWILLQIKLGRTDKQTSSIFFQDFSIKVSRLFPFYCFYCFLLYLSTLLYPSLSRSFIFIEKRIRATEESGPYTREKGGNGLIQVEENEKKSLRKKEQPVHFSENRCVADMSRGGTQP